MEEESALTPVSNGWALDVLFSFYRELNLYLQLEEKIVWPLS